MNDSAIKFFFPGFELTADQQEALQHIDDFLSGEQQVFLLCGYAGTGKTFLMNGLTKYLQSQERTFVLLAPTGRAAKVLKEKTGLNATTIHKEIYLTDALKEYKTKEEDGTETFKYFFELKRNERNDDAVFLVDEASMISDVYSEGEFFRFGSGFLLRDLFEYIKLFNQGTRRKVIFIGDNAQLPPVNMPISPALDTDYLWDKCGLKAELYQLSEVVRQKAESGILQNATRLRSAIQENQFTSFKIDTTPHDIISVHAGDLTQTYLQACKGAVDEETIIIAYSNRLVKEYNDLIRSLLFPGKPDIVSGDRLLIAHNNYTNGVSIFNGDFLTVTAVDPVKECRNITLRRKDKRGKVVEIEVPLVFRFVTVEMQVQNERFSIPCYILENLLHSKERDLSSDEQKALYIDFKIRHPKLSPGTPEFGQVLRGDGYFNALRAKFGYAATCHKAQGGEWKRVFIDFSTTMAGPNRAYFRWAYTAITRARETVFTLHLPEFSVVPKIHFAKDLHADGTHIDIPETALDQELDFTFKTPALKAIFLACWDILKDQNVSVDAIKSTDFREQYTISQGLKAAKLTIDYNKNGIITTLSTPPDSPGFAQQACASLQVLIKKFIRLPDEEGAPDTPEIELEFPADRTFLLPYFQHLRELIKQEGFHLTAMEHLHFRERCRFTKNGQSATLDFLFKATGVISNVGMVPSKGDPELGNQLLTTISKIT